MSNTYFCINCGYDAEEDFKDDITQLKDLEERDLKILNHFGDQETDHEKIICSDCTDHYFHTGLCPLCHDYPDYCQGHGYEEEKAFGDCPICELPARAGADTEGHGDWCRWHSLLELREHYESTTENQSD